MLWQIHIFAEGNTRTTAVFFIKYLRTLGFDATNDIFAENAWYFRNALVRANYNDLQAGVHATTEFLELFLRNMLLNETNPLHNRSMHISGIFDNFQKQDIEAQKQDIEIQEQDIEAQKYNSSILYLYDSKLKNRTFSKKTLKHIQKLYDRFGIENVFGRTEIVTELGITESPASEWIRKLLETEIIIPVQGMGKGKYVFYKQQNI